MKPWPILPHGDMFRADFEEMHPGRNLNRHCLRGTYVSAPIAALWNQHVRTLKFIMQRQSETL